MKTLQGCDASISWMNPGRHWAVAFLVLLCIVLTSLFAAQAEALATIAEKTKGMQKHAGLLDFYTDPTTGKVWLQLPAANDQGEHGRYLYFEGLLTGLGSNPVGLDRSQLGETRYIRLRSLGGRVFLEQLNTWYRALSPDALESRAAEQSFATSVLWAADVAARDEGGAVLVDFTSFLVRDAHGVSNTLSRSDQGSFSLDDNRSAVDLNACLGFPENIVFEAMLTFEGSKPGREVRATAPDPESITLTLHHSILQLPDDGYQTRALDPRIGSFAIEFADFHPSADFTVFNGYTAQGQVFAQYRRSHRARNFPDLISADVDTVAIGGKLVSVEFKPDEHALRVRLAFNQGIAADKIIFLGFQRHGKANTRFIRIGFKL